MLHAFLRIHKENLFMEKQEINLITDIELAIRRDESFPEYMRDLIYAYELSPGKLGFTKERAPFCLKFDNDIFSRLEEEKVKLKNFMSYDVAYNLPKILKEHTIVYNKKGTPAKWTPPFYTDKRSKGYKYFLDEASAELSFHKERVQVMKEVNTYIDLIKKANESYEYLDKVNPSLVDEFNTSELNRFLKE